MTKEDYDKAMELMDEMERLCDLMQALNESFGSSRE
jgi:hypothetical protein